jgi:hypothetical protein
MTESKEEKAYNDALPELGRAEFRLNELQEAGISQHHPSMVVALAEFEAARLQFERAYAAYRDTYAEELQERNIEARRAKYDARQDAKQKAKELLERKEW